VQVSMKTGTHPTPAMPKGRRAEADDTSFKKGCWISDGVEHERARMCPSGQIT